MDNKFFMRQIPILGEKCQEKLKDAAILVAGVGGLGSLVSQMLVRSGIGTLYLIDDGVVDAPDLNRQILYGTGDIGRKKVEVAKERLEKIGLETQIFVLPVKITPTVSFPEKIHGIVDCLDNFESRYILDDWAQKIGVFLVHGGIHGLWGQVTSIIPGRTPSLKEIFQKIEGPKEIIPVMGPVPAMIASLQSLETVKLLCDLPENLANQMLLIHLKDYSVQKIQIQS